jgi:hypothetical protein
MSYKNFIKIIPKFSLFQTPVRYEFEGYFSFIKQHNFIKSCPKFFMHQAGVFQMITLAEIFTLGADNDDDDTAWSSSG